MKNLTTFFNFFLSCGSKKANSFYFISIIVCLMQFACSPIYYGPSAHNVPIFREKNDLRLSAAFNGNQVNAQGAYAITNHLAAQANIFSGGYSYEFDDASGNGHLLEAGFGYFNAFSKHLVFECYGLAAAGKMENHFPKADDYFDAYVGDISAQVSRYAIQPSISYTTPYFEAALSPRFSSLNYSNINGNLKSYDSDEVKYLKDHHSSILFEPALTIRGGFKNIKLQLQVSQSTNLTHPDFKQQNSNSTIGILIAI